MLIISTAFEMDAIWDEDFKLSCYAAVETLAQLNDDSCDLDMFKSKLENKYKLKLIQDKPTIIEEIK